MIIGLLYWALILLCCGYAAALGGADGRWGVALFLAATVGTVAAGIMNPRWNTSNMALFIADTVYLVTLYVLVLRSQCWWPIWSTGFQLLAVTTHIATFLNPHFAPNLYRAMSNLWAVPLLVSMVIGVHLDQYSQRFRHKGR